MNKRLLSRELKRIVRFLRGRPALTAAEFERAYAERSEVTVEWLRAQGRVVRRCKCGDEMCEGWQSISQEDVDRDEAIWRAGRYRAPDWIEP